MENIEQPTTEVNGAQLSLEEGSILGKFKDATSLLNAYNSLQAEFTRKSQKLKELEKSITQTDLLSQKESASQEPSVAEKVASENNNCLENFSSEETLSNKLLKFAQDNPSSVDYLEQIKQELASSGLQFLPNGIEIAYRLVKEQQKYEPAEILNNPQFIQDYILPNNQITTLVIDEYIKSLAQGKAPKVISGESKTTVFSPNENQPKTLADANKIFSKMLEK